MRVRFLPFSVLLFAAASAFGVATDELLARLQPQGPVSDFANVFSTNERAALEGYLREVQDKTTAEIAVVALPSLEGGEISDFANKLFAKWGIGQKGKDNGAMLIAAIQDRKVRIEVGYGLEGAINDAKAGRILDESVLPQFKAQRFAAGLTQGAQAIGALVLQDTGQTNAAAAPSSVGGSFPVGAVIFLVFVATIVMLGVVAKKKGWATGTGSGGSRHGGSSSSGSRGGFGGGRSGGGGASRGW